MIHERLFVACLLVSLGCGARSQLNDPARGDDGSPVGGAGIGGHTGIGGEAGDQCTAPAASMATLDGALVPLPIWVPFDGDSANEGDDAIYSATSTSTDFLPGMFEQALRVGEPGFVTLTGSRELLADADQLTIALWFRHADGVSGMPLLDCRSLTNGFHTYRSSGGLTTCWGAGTPQVGPGGCVSIELDDCDWHHLIIRQKSKLDVVDVFLDGNWKTAIGEGGFLLFGGELDLLVGAANTGDFENDLTFEVDELRIYEAAVDDESQCEWIVGGTWQGGACVF